MFLYNRTQQKYDLDNKTEVSPCGKWAFFSVIANFIHYVST